MSDIRVLVFGAFDVIHDGHRHFLTEAKKYGNHLTVAVARDSTIIKLKGHMPERPLPNRIHDLKKEKLAESVVPGDMIIRDWKIVRKLKPDVICVGYDQHHLKEELTKALPFFTWNLKLVSAGSYKGRTLHSTHLKKLRDGN